MSSFAFTIWPPTTTEPPSFISLITKKSRPKQEEEEEDMRVGTRERRPPHPTSSSQPAQGRSSKTHFPHTSLSSSSKTVPSGRLCASTRSFVLVVIYTIQFGCEFLGLIKQSLHVRPVRIHLNTIVFQA